METTNLRRAELNNMFLSNNTPILYPSSWEGNPILPIDDQPYQEVIVPRTLPFIEANTKEVTLDHLKDECIIPVFSKDNEVTIAIQVNGKMRGPVLMAADLDNDTVVANVGADEKIARFLEKQGGSIIKTIVVKNKLVNLIVK